MKLPSHVTYTGTAACLLLAALWAAPQTVAAQTATYSSLAAGQFHTCVVQSVQEVPASLDAPVQNVLCWGSNSSGQLGNNVAGAPVHEYSQATPVKVIGLIGQVKQLSAGAVFTCALSSTGYVQCWGDNFQDELGTDNWDITYPWPAYGDSVAPLTVSLPNNITQISAGTTHTCALNSLGAIYCWGDNRNFELGNSVVFNYSPYPIKVNLPSPALSVSAGDSFTCALLIGNEVRCWGSDDHSQLGDAQTTLQGDKAASVQVQGLTISPIKISAGDSFACAIDSGGKEQCWGDDSAGQIGDGVNYPNLIAISAKMVALSPLGIMATGSSRETNCSTFTGTASGLRCWGDNYWSELGAGLLATSYNTPSKVKVFQQFPAITVITAPTEISAGFDYACAIASASSIRTSNLPTQHVYCWGHNDYGQVGNGDTTFSYWNSVVTLPTEIL